MSHPLLSLPLLSQGPGHCLPSIANPSQPFSELPSASVRDGDSAEGATPGSQPRGIIPTLCLVKRPYARSPVCKINFDFRIV